MIYIRDRELEEIRDGIELVPRSPSFSSFVIRAAIREARRLKRKATRDAKTDREPTT